MVFIQLNSKKALTLKACSLIAYHVHAVLLNSSLRWNSRPINNGHTVVRFLSFDNAESLEFFVGDDVISINWFTSGPTVEV